MSRVRVFPLGVQGSKWLKSLFLLILSSFERCRIPSGEKPLDLHLETNKKPKSNLYQAVKSNNTKQKNVCSRSFS